MEWQGGIRRVDEGKGNSMTEGVEQRDDANDTIYEWVLVCMGVRA